MRWGAFFGTTVIIAIIILFEWPRMKGNSKKDKLTFFTLFFIGLVLSMFNLPEMTGPTAWIETIFKSVWKVYGNVNVCSKRCEFIFPASACLKKMRRSSASASTQNLSRIPLRLGPDFLNNFY